MKVRHHLISDCWKSHFLLLQQSKWGTMHVIQMDLLCTFKLYCCPTPLKNILLADCWLLRTNSVKKFCRFRLNHGGRFWVWSFTWVKNLLGELEANPLHQRGFYQKRFEWWLPGSCWKCHQWARGRKSDWWFWELENLQQPLSHFGRFGSRAWSSCCCRAYKVEIWPWPRDLVGEEEKTGDQEKDQVCAFYKWFET